MKYQEITCKEFNDKYGTNLSPEMTYCHADGNLEEIFDYETYYLDLCEEPPVDWAEDCQSGGWDKDSFEYYHISGIGHLAIYQLR